MPAKAMQANPYPFTIPAAITAEEAETMTEDPRLTEESSAHAVEEPASEEQVAQVEETETEDDVLDDARITPQEIAEAGKEIVARIRDSVLIPVWRAGRHYLNVADAGADAVVDGIKGKKKGKD